MIQLAPRTYSQALGKFFKTSTKRNANGIEVYEVTNETLLLKNPLDRLVMDPVFKMNVSKAAYQFMTLVSGMDRNHQVPANTNFKMQLEAAIRYLSDKSNSSGFNLFFSKSDDVINSNVLVMQLIPKDEKLQAITTISSCNMVHDLPLIVYFTTLIQELICVNSDLKLDAHHYNVGTLSITEDDIDIINEAGIASRWPFLMERMPKITMSELYELGQILAKAYLKYASGQPEDYRLIVKNITKQNWLDNQIGLILSKKYSDEGSSKLNGAYRLITDTCLKRAIRNLVGSEYAHQVISRKDPIAI